MATAVLSGRIDEDIKAKAAPYLRAAGLTAGDVIKNVWERIALTGEVPLPIATEGETGKQKSAFENLMRIRQELPPCPELATMTDAQMRTMIAEKYL